MPSAVVLGRGVAGLSCAALLAARGWTVEVRGDRPTVPPAMLLNPVTCGLFVDVWGSRDVLADASGLDRRVTAWADAPSAEMPDPGVVVAGSALLDRLESVLGSSVPARTVDAPTWVLDARGRPRSQGSGDESAGGRRCVLAAEFEVTPDPGQRAAAMASTPDGWVFVLPLPQRRVLVQAMVAEPPDDPTTVLTGMLTAARGQLGELVPVGMSATRGPVVLPAAAGLHPPLAEPGRLRVGDRGISVDPLCGDGTGYALRTALLACACIAAIEDGEPQSAVLAHYETRLRAAYSAHLQSCLGFYGATLATPAWQAELERMRASLGQSPSAGRPAYALVGRSLVRQPAPGLVQGRRKEPGSHPMSSRSEASSIRG